MKHSALTLLARAYVARSDAPRSLKTIQHLAFGGIMVGTCALMLSLIITRGFEKEIGEKMKGINSDALLCSPGHQLDYDDITTFLRDSKLAPFIGGMSPSSTRHMIVDINGQQTVQYLRAIDPIQEAKVSRLPEKVIAPASSTLDALILQKNGAVIGSQAAINLHLWLGDTFTIYVPRPGNGSSLSLEKKALVVTGIFQLGIEEYDANIMYCSFETMRSFFDDCSGVDQIAVSFQRPTFLPAHSWWNQIKRWYYQLVDSDDALRHRQAKKLALLLSGLVVREWEDLYPDLVASLKLETYALSLVLALITLVASMLMTCLLFMLITHKRHDIAILRTLGMSRSAIHSLFSRIGMLLVAIASSTGLGLAALIGWWIQTYKPIRLPAVYYVAHLPAVLEPGAFILVFCITLLLGMLACHIPLRALKTLSVAQVLRGN